MDVIGEEKFIGKRTGTDEDLMKLTYPSYYGLEKSKEIAIREIELAKNSIKDLNLPVEELLNVADFILERKA